MSIAFIIDPLDDFKIYKDSTYAMMREAAARGHALLRAAAGRPRLAQAARVSGARAARCT